MEGLHTVAQLLRRNDYLTKIDISDFYHHFLLRRKDGRSMRFMWEGVKYECIGMPFGLAPAPRLATKMLAPAIRYLRRLGIRAPPHRSAPGGIRGTGPRCSTSLCGGLPAPRRRYSGLLLSYGILLVSSI